MQELMLRPTICRFQTCQEFVDQYHIGGGTIIDIAKILALDNRRFIRWKTSDQTDQRAGISSYNLRYRK